MRRLSISIFLVLGAMVCSAKDVAPKVAEGIARAFFSNAPATKASASSLKLLWDGMELGPSTKSYSATPPFYVYGLEDGKGFVIVSGDDICTPVLGFSYDQNFDPDDIPVAMRDWLEMTRTVINEGRKRGVAPVPTVSSAWRAATKASSPTPLKKLATALWNQTAPYNWKSPVLDINKGHVYTGCVNTAQAIVMRYWKYPSAGKGTLPGYDYVSYDGGTIRHHEGHALGHTYDWNNMPMKYESGYSEASGNAVATLMYDLGVMNHSNWGYTGTSAYLGVTGCIKYMGYDPGAHKVSMNEYDLDFWYSLLRREIDEDRPVLYEGTGKTESHAFILDGYATDDYFSFNWGWGGTSNGYFTIDPSKGNKDLLEFSRMQDAVIGVKPDDGVDEYLDDILLRVPSPKSDIADAMRHGRSTFNVKVNVMNYSNQKVVNTIRPALMNNGQVLRMLSEGIACRLQGNSNTTLTFECEFPAGLKAGDYIALGHVDSDGKWRQYPYNNNTIELGGSQPLGEELQLILDGNVMTFYNDSRCSYVEIEAPHVVLEPGEYCDFYRSAFAGKDFKVVIYGCFDTQELTIRL